MRVLSKKITAIALATVIALGAIGGTTASAKELSQGDATAETGVTSSKPAIEPYATPPIIYTDGWTSVYTGQGSEKWLHLTPKSQGLPIQLRMTDYNGKVVWTDTVPSTETSHWYVGANVKSVELRGGPCPVNVSITDH